jgi:hypothetical protein
MAHRVTIGASAMGRKGVPVIGIGTGATLVGHIKIGNGAKIAANTLVISNIPAGATVMGVPGRIVMRAKRRRRFLLPVPRKSFQRRRQSMPGEVDRQEIRRALKAAVDTQQAQDVIRHARELLQSGKAPDTMFCASAPIISASRQTIWREPWRMCGARAVLW